MPFCSMIVVFAFINMLISSFRILYKSALLAILLHLPYLEPIIGSYGPVRRSTGDKGQVGHE